jgi:hypothetical protein
MKSKSSGLGPPASIAPIKKSGAISQEFWPLLALAPPFALRLALIV